MQPALKRAIFAFVLASPFLFSFAALMQQQKGVTTDPCYLLAFSTASFPTDINADSQAPFNNSTYTQIYNYIEGNPGVQFRGVCAALSLPVGLAQYHLGILVKSGLVSFIRDGR